MKDVTRAAVLGISACALALPLAAPAAAQEGPPLPPGVSVMADGLVGPLQVEVSANGSIYVSEAFAGQVTEIDEKGRRSVLAGGLGGFAPGVGVHGGRVFVTTSDFSGGGEDEPEVQTGASLLTISQGGKVVSSVDLLQYELDENPDGQVQYDPDTGEELDTVTNPYDVLALPGRTLIADAGANVINEVSANGRVRTLTVLPVIASGECARSGFPNNTSPESNTCDSVPTGIVMGPDGFLYVSGLGGEVAGHVYKIDARTGAIVETWSGLPPLTGIAVAPDGTLYVSAFTSEEVQEVLRVDPSTGQVTGSVELPTATGLTWSDGRLLVTSAFTGMLFSVEPSAFS